MGFAGLAGREGSRGKNQDINSALKGKNSYRLTYNTGFVIWSQLAFRTQRTRVAAKILSLFLHFLNFHKFYAVCSVSASKFINRKKL